MAAKPPRSRTVLTAPHEVRIVGGQWKRSKLAVADRPGLRPTPDRVRETLFNWLGQDLTGWRCFDAYAGTGALGFEAASRGASAVQLWETDAALLPLLRAVQQRLVADMVRIERGDGLAGLRRQAAGSLDLVLLDPPFENGPWAAALDAALPALAPGGKIYLEAPTAWDDAALAPHGLVQHRYLRAGAVHAHLLAGSEPLKTPAA